MPSTKAKSLHRRWRKPTLADRRRVCRARSPFETRPFYVVWNRKFKCWGIYGRAHILIAVHEILSPKRKRVVTSSN